MTNEPEQTIHYRGYLLEQWGDKWYVSYYPLYSTQTEQRVRWQSQYRKVKDAERAINKKLDRHLERMR